MPPLNQKTRLSRTPIDVTNLPADLLAGNRYPGFLLAYALPQSTPNVSILAPMDYNNMGMTSAQPIRVDLDDFSPITGGTPVGRRL